MIVACPSWISLVGAFLLLTLGSGIPLRETEKELGHATPRGLLRKEIFRHPTLERNAGNEAEVVLTAERQDGEALLQRGVAERRRSRDVSFFHYESRILDWSLENNSCIEGDLTDVAPKDATPGSNGWCANGFVYDYEDQGMDVNTCKKFCQDTPACRGFDQLHNRRRQMCSFKNTGTADRFDCPETDFWKLSAQWITMPDKGPTGFQEVKPSMATPGQNMWNFNGKMFRYQDAGKNVDDCLFYCYRSTTPCDVVEVDEVNETCKFGANADSFQTSWNHTTYMHDGATIPAVNDSSAPSQADADEAAPPAPPAVAPAAAPAASQNGSASASAASPAASPSAASPAASPNASASTPPVADDVVGASDKKKAGTACGYDHAGHWTCS